MGTVNFFNEYSNFLQQIKGTFWRQFWIQICYNRSKFRKSGVFFVALAEIYSVPGIECRDTCWMLRFCNGGPTMQHTKYALQASNYFNILHFFSTKMKEVWVPTYDCLKTNLVMLCRCTRSLVYKRNFIIYIQLGFKPIPECTTLDSRVSDQGRIFDFIYWV